MYWRLPPFYFSHVSSDHKISSARSKIRCLLVLHISSVHFLACPRLKLFLSRYKFNASSDSELLQNFNFRPPATHPIDLSRRTHKSHSNLCFQALSSSFAALKPAFLLIVLPVISRISSNTYSHRNKRLNIFKKRTFS